MKRIKKWTRHHIRRSWEKLKPRPHMPKREQQLRKVAIVIIGAALAFAVFMFLYIIYLLIVLPSPSELKNKNLTESTLIMDREGNLLYAIHGEENRNSLDSLDEISPWLIDATIAIEDDAFYSHFGVDIPGLIKAVLSEVGIGTPRGGSTITQQFVKNTFLSSEHTYRRKLKEIILSLLVELKFNKDEILLMYLNAIPYGSNAYGIELAADKYFNKSASELTLAESVILAGIPQAPTRYSPYGNYRYSVLNFELSKESLGNREITGEADLEEDEFTRGLIGNTFEMPDGDTFYIKGRSDIILSQMLALKMIDEATMNATLTEIQELEFTPYGDSIEAPHFVLWIKQQLEDKYGSEVVEQGGLKVTTTIDPEFQTAAETAIEERKEHNSENYDADNAAMVSIHPQTGQILAMVGSADYFDDEIDGQVNMITSMRQPGSSFKPFIYALAFLNQYTPATVLYDVQTKIGTDTPANYDGTFLGPVSIRTALAQSRNIPAAKAYFLAGQEEALIPFLKPFGFDSIHDEGNYGWPLALGTAELTPLELAEGYMVLANGGTHIEPTAILKIENADGETMEEWREKDIKRENVLDPQVAYLLNDILSDPSVNLGPSVRVDSIDNAAKTGTSNTKDSGGRNMPNNAWLAAYTPTLVTITWAGNADGSPMNGYGSGYSTAAPIWKSYITAILDRLEPTDWNRPEGIKELAISRASGKLPSDQTPSDMIKTEIFTSFAIPTAIDDAYQTLLIETVTDRLATAYSPEDSVEEKSFRVHRSILADIWPNWQAGVDAWAEKTGESQAPTESAENIHNANTAANIPDIEITSPSNLSSVPSDERFIKILVDILDEGNGIDQVEFYMGDNLNYQNSEPPYDGSVRLPVTAKEGDILTITVRIVDIYGYSTRKKVQVVVGALEEE